MNKLAGVPPPSDSFIGAFQWRKGSGKVRWAGTSAPAGYGARLATVAICTRRKPLADLRWCRLERHHVAGFLC